MKNLGVTCLVTIMRIALRSFTRLYILFVPLVSVLLNSNADISNGFETAELGSITPSTECAQPEPHAEPEPCAVNLVQ
jgi:hypothetical protein